MPEADKTHAVTNSIRVIRHHLRVLGQDFCIITVFLRNTSPYTCRHKEFKTFCQKRLVYLYMYLIGPVVIFLLSLILNREKKRSLSPPVVSSWIYLVNGYNISCDPKTCCNVFFQFQFGIDRFAITFPSSTNICIEKIILPVESLTPWTEWTNQCEVTPLPRPG